MTSKSRRPSAEADIDELHAWATGASSGAGAAQTAPAAAKPTATASVPTSGKTRTKRAPTLRGSTLLPKALLVIAVGLAAYLVFSFVLGLLMTLLMIVGGAALLYAAYRIGLWQGRRGK